MTYSAFTLTELQGLAKTDDGAAIELGRRLADADLCEFGATCHCGYKEEWEKLCDEIENLPPTEEYEAGKDAGYAQALIDYKLEVKKSEGEDMSVINKNTRSRTITKDEVSNKLERYGRNRPCSKWLARVCEFPDVEDFDPLARPEDMQCVVNRLTDFGSVHSNGSGGRFYAACYSTLGMFEVTVESSLFTNKGSLLMNLAVCQLLKNVERAYSDG